MRAAKRLDLAGRRRNRGFSQEALAAQLRVDRSTVARWERGQSDPQPYQLLKLASLLDITLEELHEMLTREDPQASTAHGRSSSAVLHEVSDTPVPLQVNAFDELDGVVERRELLRLLSVAGALIAAPSLLVGAAADLNSAEQLEQYERLNAHLWQVFSLSPSKRAVYPVVRQQLRLLMIEMAHGHSAAPHRRLCVLTADLLQLAGEIFFDADRYADAAHCYTLAAGASREAEAFDMWACALTRHAYLDIYEQKFADAEAVLDGAARIASRGDSELPTRQWVSSVRAETCAGLTDFNAFERALETAEQVRTAAGGTPDGWLRFDGGRLVEQRGNCYATLGQADLATSALTEALDSSPSLRRRGSILTDLAVVGAQSRDLDQVIHYGQQAADLAEQTRSAGYVGRKLATLQANLSPFLGDTRAIQLNQRITQLQGV